MTETASLISLNHPFRATAGSVGKIVPGLECKLGDDGKILVRGESVAAGYWSQIWPDCAFVGFTRESPEALLARSRLTDERA